MEIEVRSAAFLLFFIGNLFSAFSVLYRNPTSNFNIIYNYRNITVNVSNKGNKGGIKRPRGLLFILIITPIITIITIFNFAKGSATFEFINDLLQFFYEFIINFKYIDRDYLII